MWSRALRSTHILGLVDLQLEHLSVLFYSFGDAVFTEDFLEF